MCMKREKLTVVESSVKSSAGLRVGPQVSQILGANFLRLEVKV